jgi:hypothetical protein
MLDMDAKVWQVKHYKLFVPFVSNLRKKTFFESASGGNVVNGYIVVIDILSK